MWPSFVENLQGIASILLYQHVLTHSRRNEDEQKAVLSMLDKPARLRFIRTLLSQKRFKANCLLDVVNVLVNKLGRGQLPRTNTFTTFALWGECF